MTARGQRGREKRRGFVRLAVSPASRASQTVTLNMQGRRRIQWGWVAATGVALALAAASPRAYADVVQPASSGDSYPLLNAHTVNVPGTRDSSGTCDFSAYPITLSPDGPQAIEARQLDRNPATCSAVYQVGEPPAAQAQAEASAAAADPTATTTTTTSQSADLAQPRQGLQPSRSSKPRGHRRAYYKETVKDAPGLDVNWVRNTIAWSYSRGCIRGRVDFGESDYWRGETGWIRIAHDFKHGVACQDAYSASGRHFYNGIFCALLPVDVYYYRNSIHAGPDGGFTTYPGVKISSYCPLPLHSVQKSGYY